MKLSDYIYTLELPNNTTTINPVLVCDNNELIIIDVAFPGQMEMIKSEMAKYGFSPNQITKVIFTHQDIDHIGCINDIKSANPNVAVYCHTEEAKYIDGTEMPIKLKQRLANYDNMTEEEKIGINNLKAGFEARQTKMDGLLNHGDVLPYAGGMHILHTPGHTPGHICIYFEKDKVLVTGDALNKKDGVLTGPNPGFTKDMDLALNSLKKLTDMDIQTIVCYHGGIINENAKESLENIKKYQA